MRIFILIIAFIVVTSAKDFDYNLKAIQLAKNSYYIYGKEEYFSKQNGGDIANVSFIETDKSVILIDTGSSFAYGSQVKKLIEEKTKKPVKHIINTHHHSDHFLGNNAFKNATIYSDKFTAKEIKRNGELYIKNLFVLLGETMKGTKIKNVDIILQKDTKDFDGYKLHFYYLKGHTKSDLVIYDKNTNILYASDLVFNNRALATIDANLEEWINSLNLLKKIDYDICVPGHGKAFKGKTPLDLDIKYLDFLKTTLEYGNKNGLNVFEILDLKVPKEIKNFSMFEEEYERSIINLSNKQ